MIGDGAGATRRHEVELLAGGGGRMRVVGAVEDEFGLLDDFLFVEVAVVAGRPGVVRVEGDGPGVEGDRCRKARQKDAGDEAGNVGASEDARHRASSSQKRKSQRFRATGASSASGCGGPLSAIPF